jgi:tRNA threonylcarbamoyladenosine biosynthesis protein TsaB
MIVLGLDAASTACSAAVVIDGRVAAERFAAMERGQAEADVAVTGLGAVAVTVGPGAFTGVRIGLAAARGLAVAAGLPCIGVTTFEAVAEPAYDDLRAATLVAAIESKREEVFLQAFSAARGPLGDAFAAAPEDAAGLLPEGELVVAGDAAQRLVAGLHIADPGRPARIAVASGSPRASFVAMIGARRIQAGAVGDLPRPFYLRPPDARPMMDAVKK